MRRLGLAISRARVLSIAVLILCLNRVVDAQVTATLALRGSAVAAGLPNTCSSELRPGGDVDAPATVDSIRVRVVNDSTPASGTPSPARLVVLVGADTLGELRVGDTVATFTDTSRTPGRTLIVTRRDSQTALCAVDLRPIFGRIITDPIVRQLVARDSAQLDSLRNRQRLRGNSFIVLSLIKSISGEIPDAEFFDLRMKFGGEVRRGEPRGKGLASWISRQYRKVDARLFTFASLDVSLSTRADTSAADSLRRRLTDATLSLNLMLSGDSSVLSPRTSFISAPYFKVFNTKSYLGAGYGGLELRGSRLEGTMVQVSYLYQLYPDSAQTTTGNATSFEKVKQRNHVFLEFFVRVPGAQFLDRLRLRGGVLLPVGRRVRPETRIVLSIPIVDLDRF